jgi:NAD(P)H dehydrogenase (quinone)|tara:strand:+ start:86 stop:697 length:612 start_codon:yes stop_codon:yes gene_type:complete
MTKIAILEYSMYGHITTLARSIKKGLESTGAEVKHLRCKETLPDEILEKMHAPPKPQDIEEFGVANANELNNYDGVMFGVSARFGGIPAQMKTIMDATGGLWQNGGLVGKSAGVFQSTGTMQGGQESVGINCMSFFAHQGMIFIPLGYTDPQAFSYDEIHGASPWGSGTYAGPDGSRQPTVMELSIAENHGKHFATLTEKLSR